MVLTLFQKKRKVFFLPFSHGLGLDYTHRLLSLSFLDDDNFDEYPEEEGWDYITMGNQKLVIKTAVIEDKRTAVEMISTYARDLEEHFAPYVDAALKTTIPLVGFVFDIGVRQAAAGVAPLLLNCLKKANAGE